MSYQRAIAIVVTLAVAVFMVSSPQSSVTAALGGLELWAKVLVPALLPFFIIAELLVALGVVRMLGDWLEPLLRPAFRLPGAASLAIVMGFCAGFPMGAVLSRRLYEEGLATRAEAERLCCFTNNSSPLFILGAVGVGMFGSATVGYLLAGCHYLSNLCVGLLLGLAAPPADGMAACRRPPREETPPGKLDPGALLTAAVKNSLNNILAVGGFVMLFAIVTALCRQWGVLALLARLIQGMLAPLGVSLPLAAGMAVGLLEISLGAQAVSAVQAPLTLGLPAVSAVLAGGGLSILAQVISAAAPLPVRVPLYLGCRLAQMALATGFSVIALRLFGSGAAAAAVMLPPSYKLLYTYDMWHIVGGSLLAALTLSLLMLTLAWRRGHRSR